MNITRSSARPALGWLFTLLVIGLVGSFWAPTAHAVDNTLVSSTPGAGTTVEASPTTIELKFAQPLGPKNTVSMTCGTEGTLVPLGNGRPVDSTGSIEERAGGWLGPCRDHLRENLQSGLFHPACTDLESDRRPQ